jgi:UDP-glucose 4-epimerase
MHVLLVGGNGFVGSHLVDSFLDSGCEVTVVDLHRELYRMPLKRVRYCIGDLDDEALALAALRGVDIVVYCASTTVPQSSADDPVSDVATNLMPFLRFLRRIGQTHVRRFVFFSSGGTVYGSPTLLPIPETHPTHPIVSHGIVKLTIEKYLQAFSISTGVEVVILRVGNAFGPRQNPYGRFGAVATFLGCFAQQRPIKMWGDGSIMRDYIHVADVAIASVAAAATKGISGIYNIGSSTGVTLNELVRTISEVTGVPAPPIENACGRSFDIPRIVLDSSLARRNLGWVPRVSLSEGINMTWEWVKNLEE